jgi:ElaB/YqjD/DUF883 family membrane-anchored ribosome-binding protein
MAERSDLTSASWQGQDVVSGHERSADEIRQDIAARRESITETVDRLSDRFQQTLNWRAYVSDYPLVALGVVAGLGFLAARIFKPRPSAGKRIKDALAYGIEDLAGRFQHQLGNLPPHKSGSGLSRAVKAVVAGAVTDAATNYLRNRFVDQFADRNERHPEYELEYEPRLERDSELFR